MYLLDTNVISERMKPTPAPEILAWLKTVPENEAAIPSPVLAEILFGLRRMGEGKRQKQLYTALNDLSEDVQIVSFDAPAAAFYAVITVQRMSIGRPIGIFDALIASIARANDMTIVTRDIDGFEHCGVAILNPWTQGCSTLLIDSGRPVAY
ncbi:MAG: type II toxin-antitoxin system VapC family toxin [Pseudomonadota bacterium]